MAVRQIEKMEFSRIYPLYVQKAQRKNRTQQEVNEIITWLCGYDEQGILKCIEEGVDLEAFFNNAPDFNEKSSLIKGSICGIKVENIEDKLIQKIRYLDKLIDELSKGKSMEKILRK